MASPDITHVRVLQQAVRVLGGEPQLATALNVSPEVLAQWLAGEARPTTKAYFTALSVVTADMEERWKRVRPGG